MGEIDFNTLQANNYALSLADSYFCQRIGSHPLAGLDWDRKAKRFEEKYGIHPNTARDPSSSYFLLDKIVREAQTVVQMSQTKLSEPELWTKAVENTLLHMQNDGYFVANRVFFTLNGKVLRSHPLNKISPEEQEAERKRLALQNHVPHHRIEVRTRHHSLPGLSPGMAELVKVL